MNKSFKILLLSLLSASFCNLTSGIPLSKNDTARHSIDSAVILFHLPQRELIHFFYQDDYNTPSRASQYTDESGFLRIALYVSHNLTITFTNGMTMYPVLVIPGDSLTVRKTYQNDQSNYEFRSNKHVYANFLNEVERAYGFFWGSLQLSPGMNTAYYRKEVKKLNAQRLALLKQYERADTLGCNLATYLQRELKSRYIMDLCAPYHTRDFNYQEKVPREYAIELDTLMNELNCDTCVTSMRYRLAIRNYLLYLSRDSLYGNNEFSTVFRNAYSRFTGNSRDVALFITMQNYIEKDHSAVLSHLPDFDAKCKNAGYKNFIDSLALRESMLVDSTEGSNSLLTDSEGITHPFKSILSAHKGKVVLLDFWASWCAPCRAETPYMKSLVEKYSKQELAVIFISIDEKSDKWAAAIEQLGLKTAGNHYLLDAKQPLSRLVGIPPIPRYILIDQAGRIVALNAPRPSEPVLNVRIEKLLRDNAAKTAKVEQGSHLIVK